MLYLFLAAVLILADLWLLGRRAATENYAHYVSVRYGAGQISEETFSSYMKSDTLRDVSLAAAWKRAEGTEAEAATTGKIKKTDCYYVKGLPEAMYGNSLLSGRYFLEGELGGCIISRKLARDLFGTEGAAGSILKLEKKVYRVTGIVEGGEALCLLPAEKGSTFDGVTLQRKSDAQSVKQVVSGLDVQMGNTHESVIDGQFYTALANVAFTLNLAVSWLLLYVVAVYEMQVLKGKKNKLVTGIACAVFIGCIIMGIICSGFGRDYLPTYWSDFEFYSPLWREKADALHTFSAYQEFVPEQQLWRYFIQTVAGSMAAVTLQILAIFFHRSLFHKGQRLVTKKGQTT